MHQRIAEAVGENGCYFLSVIYLAEKISGRKCSHLDVYLEMVAKKYMEKDCYLNAPDKILSDLTGQKWTIEKKLSNYKCKKGELEILYFENKTTMKTFGHFVVGNGLGSVEYDPYGDSNTVKNGTLQSKRVFWKI